MRKTIAKAYPRLSRYIDVISIDEASSGKMPTKKELKDRLNSYFYVDDKLYTKKGRKFFEKKYNIAIKEHAVENSNMIQGRTAYPGIAKGRACLIINVADLKKMKKDNILVSPTTLPDFMQAIIKARAIVANEGGLLSHASIISRELKKPCIIDTKIATKVFKDGDLVEVDADKGIVRIIKKAK